MIELFTKKIMYWRKNEKNINYAGFDPREYSDNMIGVISSQDDLKSIDSDFNFVPLDKALKDVKK